MSPLGGFVFVHQRLYLEGYLSCSKVKRTQQYVNGICVWLMCHRLLNFGLFRETFVHV